MDLTEAALRRMTEGQLRDALAAGELDPVGLVPAPPLERVRVPDPKLTVLMLVAAASQNPDLVDVLVEAGAVVGTTSPLSSLTALSFAAMTNPQGAVATRLIEYGADCDRHDNEGCTPLMRAAAVGNLQAARAIIPHVSGVDTRDPRGWTALTFAVAGLNLDIADDLVAAGAARDARTDDGFGLGHVYECACDDRGIQPAPEILARFAG